MVILVPVLNVVRLQKLNVWVMKQMQDLDWHKSLPLILYYSTLFVKAL